LEASPPDTVDDGKLGGALLAFLEEALGLVEEARVFERHAHGFVHRSPAGDHRARESMLAVEVR
jgi:hypothetical protein